MSDSRARKLVVLKLGSALVTSNGVELNLEGMDDWAAQIAKLQSIGVDVVLVSSGAIAAGMVQMGWKNRPEDMASLQAAAAIGQVNLVQAWQSAFSRCELVSAQILLDGADLANRERYLNARSALLRLVNLGVIPIINENDTVVTDEIRFGDNDSLGGLVCNLIDADQFVILTDQDGLFTADPRKDPSATLVLDIDVFSPELDAYAGDSKGALGRGGMQTKLRAARYAARSGTSTFIGRGTTSNIVVDSVAGKAHGTLLRALLHKLDARKRWLASMSNVAGTITVDEGAVEVIERSGASLLPVGVTKVLGDFKRGDLVELAAPCGQVFARGLINYQFTDVVSLAGKSSSQIKSVLGWVGEDELIHRDNLTLL